MLVYRRGVRVESGSQALLALDRALRALASTGRSDRLLEALLRAGELECALADAGHGAAVQLAGITDALAAKLCTPELPLPDGTPIALAAGSLPERLQLKVPEGYAYYALSPLDYRELALRWHARSDHVLVVGVRSIGTSLGAVVRAALRARKLCADRITVRPSGHPWLRQVELDERQLEIVRERAALGAELVVVDEGPGLSGSTFLSVADAVERCGIPPDRVHFFCSHIPDPQRLCAPAAGERWIRHRIHAVHQALPGAGEVDLSGGAWRSLLPGGGAEWPAVWPQLERRKWWSADRRWVSKFEGLPPYGDAPFARAEALADSGWGPPAHLQGDGFVRYGFVEGRSARMQDASAELLTLLARYCVFRTRAFPAAAAEDSALVEMLSVNALETLGVDLQARVQLPIELPIIADARVAPHEWRVSAGGGLLKIDGNADGDGHLLPGPCDVCWDLAGVAVEWQLSPEAEDLFVAAFERLAGTRVRRRSPWYRAAYCAQRAGEMSFAQAQAEPSEADRAQGATRRYVRALARALKALQIPFTPSVRGEPRR